MATDRELLRHGLAVLAYRAAKPLRDAPATFATFTAGAGGWTALQLVTHLADLMAWAVTAVREQARYQDSVPTDWDTECRRFFGHLAELDEHVGSERPVVCSLERLLAGPIADALTHVGQLALLRRLARCPIVAESYFRADIRTGVVGPEQSAPVFAFTRPPV